MIPLDLPLQILGSLLAIFGALCNCSPLCRMKFSGFAIWIISNFTLLTWSILVGAYWLAVMYTVFMGTSVYGAWHHREKKGKITEEFDGTR